MKFISKKLESQAREGAKPKEFWDWEVKEKVLMDSQEYLKKHGAFDFSDPIFTVDGENLYVQVRENGRWSLKKNHKDNVLEGFEVLNFIKISPDGLHVAAVVNSAPHQKDKTVIVDNKKWDTSFDEIFQLEVSPDGKKVAILGKEHLPSEEFYLYENDNEIDSSYRTFKQFIYSPDGSKRALICISDEAGENDEVVLDGEWTLLSQDIKYPTYSPDGKKLAVVDDGSDIVINDERISLPTGIHKVIGQPVFSPDSEKIAYVVEYNSDDEGTVVTLVEDDKFVWLKNYKQISNIVYSDDSKNIAAVIVQTNEKSDTFRIVVNGKFIDADFYSKCEHLTFSPDGKKIMYVGLRLDGKYYRIVKDVSEFVK
ncbi:MAG: hypothetical protein NT116_06735, partial [Candidatus Parcubacteria bacterium]|nr:hypothetical protein [Candidatus Parcubacteria bacterium]